LVDYLEKHSVGYSVDEKESLMAVALAVALAEKMESV
jgi:hypothetical protein